MPNRLPPPRDFNWARTLRTLSFWALLIVGAVALLQFAQNRRQEPDISYTQFTEQLAVGVGGRDVAAELRDPARDRLLVEHHAGQLAPARLPTEARRPW